MSVVGRAGHQIRSLREKLLGRRCTTVFHCLLKPDLLETRLSLIPLPRDIQNFEEAHGPRVLYKFPLIQNFFKQMNTYKPFIELKEYKDIIS